MVVSRKSPHPRAHRASVILKLLRSKWLDASMVAAALEVDPMTARDWLYQMADDGLLRRRVKPERTPCGRRPTQFSVDPKWGGDA